MLCREDVEVTYLIDPRVLPLWLVALAGNRSWCPGGVLRYPSTGAVYLRTGQLLFESVVFGGRQSSGFRERFMATTSPWLGFGPSNSKCWGSSSLFVAASPLTAAARALRMQLHC